MTLGDFVLIVYLALVLVFLARHWSRSVERAPAASPATTVASPAETVATPPARRAA